MAKETLLPTTLPGEINAATRTLHTTLNRLITTRLPLALPPHAPTPDLYTTGLLHFSHIILTFESLWTELLSTHHSPSSTAPPTSPLLSFLLVNPYDSPTPFSTTPAPHITSFLATLRPAALPRSHRLKRDLATLLDVHDTDLDVLLAQYPSPGVAEFCAHIRAEVAVKPHVLVAYAWCFYMAVFSGGRWIRAQLAAAPSEFWRSGTAVAPPELSEKGLAFWHFGGEKDGEDVKAVFRERLEGIEGLFTDEERVDVIEEAKGIFERCVGLVEELDRVVGTDLGSLKKGKEGEKGEEGEKSRAEDVLREKCEEAPVGWMSRPEVTGAVFALGCLACVALLQVDGLRLFGL
ncbi:heme oxygenase-like protein [Polyplosphaeria fusca]|uniref:Heme oxygenase-like protein n=1 Tax=Polyplosphaeria fusca TaxID=682080 RepID=A0A9P4QZC5_9PLEO|nr:heme oxygenase-like protein [Polyplosphaeria fusca]